MFGRTHTDMLQDFVEGTLCYVEYATLKCGSPAIFRGPNNRINIRILHCGFTAQDKGIPETTVCRIFMFRYVVGHQIAAINQETASR